RPGFDRIRTPGRADPVPDLSSGDSVGEGPGADGSPEELPPSPSPPPARPGLSTFTIEGRHAPALFVIGWLASILGGGILFIGFQAPRSAGASVLILAGLALLSV